MSEPNQNETGPAAQVQSIVRQDVAEEMIDVRGKLWPSSKVRSVFIAVPDGFVMPQTRGCTQ